MTNNQCFCLEHISGQRCRGELQRKSNRLGVGEVPCRKDVDQMIELSFIIQHHIIWYINLRRAIWALGLNMEITDAQVLGKVMYVARYSGELKLIEKRSTTEGRHLWYRWKTKGHPRRSGRTNREVKEKSVQIKSCKIIGKCAPHCRNYSCKREMSCLNSCCIRHRVESRAGGKYQHRDTGGKIKSKGSIFHHLPFK